MTDYSHGTGRTSEPQPILGPTREFDFRIVLAVVSGRNISTPNLETGTIGPSGTYELVDWMTDDLMEATQMSRFYDETAPWILRWYPQFERVEEHLPKLDCRLADSDDPLASISDWIEEVRLELGLPTQIKIGRIPLDDHQVMNAYDELVISEGTDERIRTLEIPPEALDED